VIQEALNNVNRHSAAKEAWVRLRFSVAALELEVEDHGKGFAPLQGQTGIGLVAMRERAELIGGKVRVSPLARGGTLVQLRSPREKVELHAG
jgi:signal transduction histidine kinase